MQTSDAKSNGARHEKGKKKDDTHELLWILGSLSAFFGVLLLIAAVAKLAGAPYPLN